jgi:hypothetical protein
VVDRHPAPLPTFAQFRNILIRDFQCHVEPPIRNLIYVEKRITLLTRTVDDVQYEWLTCMDENERITGELALNACRHLQIPAEDVDLPDSDSAG